MLSPSRTAVPFIFIAAAALISACSGGSSGTPPTTGASPSLSPSPTASATPWNPTIQEFPLAGNRHPQDIVAGADGDLWFNEPQSGMIGRMTTSGALVAEYPVPNTSQSLSGITLGSDNNVWFGDEQANFIAKIDTAGKITEISLPTGTLPFSLTSGPDGNIWFATNSGVGKLAPASTTPTLYTLNVTGRPTGITSGPNNQIWFSESLGHRVGHVATDGSNFQEIPMPVPSASFGPGEITMGPDGNIWTAGQAFYTANTTSSFARITTTGQVSFFQTPTQPSGLCCIVSNPDGFLYGTEREIGSIANIVRIFPQSEQMQEAAIPSGFSSGPDHITTGPDGSLWFSEFDSGKIGHILH